MQSITVEMKDGTVHKFEHRGRPGGSYTIRVKYEGAFVLVTNEYDTTEAFPASEVKKVTTTERY